ncbi:protein FAM200C-like [Leucoraja erinacea]|uniref:protein FAM200C-like n=1 Tax=Leucoraja erinaceus TaxID=7782 RepID=UPI002453B8A7|nr:protein FAM200C-like [Leucoraja erinacea]
MVKPQCVICAKVLSHKNLKPNKLKIHSESCHSDLAGKGVDYFKRKEAALKGSHIDSTGHYTCQIEAVLEASYQIAYRIAQTKKPHTIGEELIKPCLLEAAKLVLGEQQSNKFRQISLSNDTVKSQISDMSDDILLQVVSGVKSSPVY